MRKILITGAAGQLGQALQLALHDFEQTNIALHGNDSGMLACDITDPNQIREVISTTKPDVIINTAAMTDVDGNEREQELARRLNTDAVASILDAAGAIGAQVVQISSDYVFDGTGGPYLESDPVSPVSVYGKTKLASEKLVLADERHMVIRGNVLWGPDLNAPASFVRWVVHSLRNRKKIRVVEDQVNNPTLTTHLAEAIAVAIRKDGQGLYHYGGLEFCNRLTFAQQLARYFDLPGDLIQPTTTAELGQVAPRPLESGLICSKMKQELGVENFSNFEAFERAFPNTTR